MAKPDKKPRMLGSFCLGHHWHFLDGSQVILFIVTEVSSLATEEVQIRFLQVELADKNIGQMLPVYDQRRSRVRQAILALINGEILTFLESGTQYCVAFGTALRGNFANTMEIGCKLDESLRMPAGCL